MAVYESEKKSWTKNKIEDFIIRRGQYFACYLLTYLCANVNKKQVKQQQNIKDMYVHDEIHQKKKSFSFINFLVHIDTTLSCVVQVDNIFFCSPHIFIF